MTEKPAPPTVYDHVVLHYAEIGTKAGNRKFFERTLAKNVERAVRPWAEVRVRREQGRLVFSLAAVPADAVDAALAAVARQPGVAWLSPACRVAPTAEALRDKVVELACARTGSFKINARRGDKTLPFSSMELNREIGAAVQAATDRPVRMKSPDDEYRIEVDLRVGYVQDARRNGPGGLPVGCSGTVVALLSGGIDSPVAAYRMMLRGCRVVAVHLWNRSFSGEGVRDKVLALGRALARHHAPLDLELVPFDGIQQEIIAAAPADLRMLLYRRAMLRVAAAVRAERKAGALVVGDAVGQVASQTLPNLAAVYDAVADTVLTPLCGANKMDTVAQAKAIGTFEISVRPGQDCCGLMVAKHPATNATAAQLRHCEEQYDLDALVDAALADREVHALEPT